LRDIVRRVAAGRRITVTALTALATIATVAALAPSALAASSVTIKTSFENSPISLNTSDAVGYAFTNTTTAAQTVTFTDNLPGGVTLDNPVGTTNTNGTGACTLVSTNAAPGATSVTTTITVPNETASGAVCTLSFSVVAASPTNDAAISDSYSGVSTATAVVPVTTVGSLTVLSNPTLTFTAPTSGQSFSLGQISDASFACAATDPKDSIDSFFGTDDEGNQIQTGAPIDTVDPGAHTLEVDCYSAAGGGDVSQSVNYTVGSYTLKTIKAAKATDNVSFKTLVPAGKIVAEIIDGKKVIGTTTVSATSRTTKSVTIKLKAAGKKLVAAGKGKSLAVKLQVSFTPQAIGTGDEEITPAAATVITKNIKLPIAHATKKK
jgi:hypothetical protein